MGKFSTLLFALTLAYWGQHLIRIGPPGQSFPIRDGLILFVIAGLLFAWNSRARRQSHPVTSGSLNPGARSGRSVWLLLAAGGLGLVTVMLFALAANSRPIGSLWLAVGSWSLAIVLLLAALLGNSQSGSFPTQTTRQRFFSIPAQTEMWIGLVLALGLALLVRLWLLLGVTGGCSGAECGVVEWIGSWWGGNFQPTGGANSVGVGFAILGGALTRLTPEPIALLRALALGLGLLTLLGVFGLGRRMAHEVGGLLAVILLAFSPLHIWFSITPTGLTLAPVWLALFAWAWMGWTRDRRPRDLILTGLGFGLLWQEAAPFRLFLLGWLLLAVGLIWIQRNQEPDLDSASDLPNRSPLGPMVFTFLLPALVGAAPALGIGLSTGTLLSVPPAIQDGGAQLTAFFAALFQPGALFDSTGILDYALLSPLAAALAITGIGWLLAWRSGRALVGLLLLLSLGVVWISPPGSLAAPLLLTLSPLFLGAAAAASGELWALFIHLWRRLLNPSRALAGTVLAMTLVAAWQGIGFVRTPDRMGDPGVVTQTDGPAGSIRPLGQNTLDITDLFLPELPMERIWQIGDGCGSDSERFAQPRGVAIDEAMQRVYVADTGNRRLAALDMLDGGLVTLYQDPLFEEPVDLARSLTGELFVLDALALNPLSRVDPATGQVTPVPLSVSFYRPRGFSIDNLGNFYVADTGGSKLVALGPEGEFYTDYGGESSPLVGLQPVDSLANWRNEVWAIASQEGRLFRLGAGTEMIVTTPANTVDGPHMAGLPDGYFFITDPEQRQVIAFTDQGRPMGRFGGVGLAKPVGIAAGQVGGQIYVAAADSEACQVVLWSMARDTLAEFE